MTAARRKKKPRPNGLVLTVKQLDRRSYGAIHVLPRGFRQETLRALLGAAADLADKEPNWFRAAIAGALTMGVRR